ncbi:MAG: hypothetical protein AB1461_15765 [Thermodesulfobacteriota bacterium]
MARNECQRIYPEVACRGGGFLAGTLLIFLVLALLRLIPFSALVPFAALLVGAIHWFYQAEQARL